MRCAVERCLEAKKHVAAYALVVDAKGGVMPKRSMNITDLHPAVITR